VREFHPLSTVSAEAQPPGAKSSLVVYPAAGVVPSLASRFPAAVKHKTNTSRNASSFQIFLGIPIWPLKILLDLNGYASSGKTKRKKRKRKKNNPKQREYNESYLFLRFSSDDLYK
jgi:hypothetical protein